MFPLWWLVLFFGHFMELRILSGLLSLSSLNGSSDVTIIGYASGNGQGSTVDFAGSQAKVDATAMAQDVIKRIQATVPLVDVKWHPGFAALADQLCKNYKVDGTNNNTVSSPPMVNSTVCPIDPVP